MQNKVTVSHGKDCINIDDMISGKFYEVVCAYDSWKNGMVFVAPFTTNQQILLLNKPEIASTDKYLGITKVKEIPFSSIITIKLS